MARKKTTDALEIIDRHFFKTKKAKANFEAAEAIAQVAREIYALRTEAGLTQKQLAKLVGTSHSVISRLEDEEYGGHSFTMLRRIAAALGKRVEIRFVPLPGSGTA